MDINVNVTTKSVQIRPTNGETKPVTQETLTPKVAREVARKIRQEIQQARKEKGNDKIPLLEIARKVQEYLKQSGIKIQLKVNQDSGKVVLIVKDPETGKVVREIPPDIYFKLSEYLNMQQETQQGREVDERI